MYQFVGRTNVGKSTLINLLVGEKIAAIANKVQTTRTQIRGIVNRENSQIIFIDTPGIHKPKTKLNENMIELSWDAISNSDVILFLIEAVSVVAALICFDINLILESNFLQYSALELLTLFLFYFRAGLVMLSFGIIISPKVAPIITIALIFTEFFADVAFMISRVWLPFRDAIVVSKLMNGEMVLSDMWGIILRALLMMFMLIFSSYFLYQKKDVLSNVKK